MSNRSVWQAHKAACEEGRHSYVDPETGYHVFTEVALKERSRCCGSGCRHCPFDHVGIALERRPSLIKQAAWLVEGDSSVTDVLFWSGGKDSYLTLRRLYAAGVENPVLLTTFAADSGVIAHQEIAIETVVQQAQQLGVALIGIPLHPGRAYMDVICTALDLLARVSTLHFGDLHLQHIRRWREETFAEDPRTSHLALSFPLWQVPFTELLDDLSASPCRFPISAVGDGIEGIAPGELFDRAFSARVGQTMDAFGENGEFHTRVEVLRPHMFAD